MFLFYQPLRDRNAAGRLLQLPLLDILIARFPGTARPAFLQTSSSSPGRQVPDWRRAMMQSARGRARRPTQPPSRLRARRDSRRRQRPLGPDNQSAAAAPVQVPATSRVIPQTTIPSYSPPPADLNWLRHELRTPLSGLLGLAELLSNQDLPLQARNWLATLQACGQQLAELIDRNLRQDLSGPIAVPASGTDGRGLLESLLLAHFPAAREAGTQLMLVFHPAAQGCWRVDGIALRQALDNLLSNAIRFSNGGQVMLAADVLPASGTQPRLLELAVEDSGPGLQNKAANLREGHEYANRAYRMPGRGLGLKVVEEFCRNHSGHLQRSSTPLGGARLAILLPATMVTDWPAVRLPTPPCPRGSTDG
jgi:signal transduction histidine kinase